MAWAAVIPIRSPPKVPETKRLGSSNIDIYFSRPHNAAIGYPFPIALENVDRSGNTPKYDCAPPRWNLNPVMTSSSMNKAPCSWAISLTYSRKPSFGSSNLIGSMMIAATSSMSKACLSVSLSLYVNFVTGWGLIPRFCGFEYWYQSCHPW